MIKARLPLLLLLLGTVFLASVSVSFGYAYLEEESPRHDKCVRSCRSEHDEYRYRACQARCELTKEDPEGRRREGEERERPEEQEQPRRREEQGREPRREREREGEEEEQEKRDPREQRHRSQERERKREREQGQERRRKEQREEREREGGRGLKGEEEREREGRSHRDDPEERARERQRRREEEEARQREERRRHEEREREERQRRREKRQQKEEREEGQGSQSQSQRNPYHFQSKRFQTRHENEHGRIRVLQRFEQRSKQLRNLQNYRLVEFESKPNTLILPHMLSTSSSSSEVINNFLFLYCALLFFLGNQYWLMVIEYILVVVRGKATITLVNPNNRDSYNVERGDALRIRAGTTAYVANRDDNHNLRVVKLAIPVNKPGQFEDFFPSNSQNPQSYFSGFSKETLEATFNTQYEEIERILLGEEREQHQQQRGREKRQSQGERVIVKVSKEQMRELSQHAKTSSPRGGIFSESGPFNLRSHPPRYSNKFGEFYAISPERNPQLQDLGFLCGHILRLFRSVFLL